MMADLTPKSVILSMQIGEFVSKTWVLAVVMNWIERLVKYLIHDMNIQEVLTKHWLPSSRGKAGNTDISIRLNNGNFHLH